MELAVPVAGTRRYGGLRVGLIWPTRNPVFLPAVKRKKKKKEMPSTTRPQSAAEHGARRGTLGLRTSVCTHTHADVPKVRQRVPLDANSSWTISNKTAFKTHADFSLFTSTGVRAHR